MVREWLLDVFECPLFVYMTFPCNIAPVLYCMVRERLYGVVEFFFLWVIACYFFIVFVYIIFPCNIAPVLYCMAREGLFGVLILWSCYFGRCCFLVGFFRLNVCFLLLMVVG